LHKLRRAERLRQSILKQAFAGRLAPQDPADLDKSDNEPASVLLARMRAAKAEGKKRGRQLELPEV
jgi:type I restriction enzyme S subunit